jgi:hypothetical protein
MSHAGRTGLWRFVTKTFGGSSQMSQLRKQDESTLEKCAKSYWKVPTLAYQELVSCGGRRSLALKNFSKTLQKSKSDNEAIISSCVGALAGGRLTGSLKN